MFANLTMPSSHNFADLNFGGMISVGWSKPTNTTSGEVGLAFVGTWLSSDPNADDVSASLDAIGLYPASGRAELFIRVSDEWGRDFNMGWSFVSDGGSNGSSLTITGASGNQVALDGTWSAGCTNDEEDQSSNSVTTISGSSISSITQFYWVNPVDCSGTFDATSMMSGTLILGNEEVLTMESSPNVLATLVDIVLSTGTMTLNNPDLVSSFNSDQACGHDDWEVGTSKDILGSCMDSIEKSVIYIDDRVNPHLWYHGNETGSNAEGYPTVIDEDNPKSLM